MLSLGDGFCFLFIWDRVLLCSSNWLGTHNPPASASLNVGILGVSYHIHLLVLKFMGKFKSDNNQNNLEEGGIKTSCLGFLKRD